MKTSKYQKRFYRDWSGAKDLYRSQVTVKETDLDIFSDKPIDKIFVEERIKLYRRQIEDYISKEPRFLTNLKPLAVELRAPLIVKNMASAAKLSGVGPMASVSGAVAEALGKDLLRQGAKEVIIENGGDVFLKSTKMRKIGFYAGKSKLWKGLSLKIAPQNTPAGICTSSGTIGHSLSFGLADSVTILAKSAYLADAVATATCNRVQSKNNLTAVLNFARSVKGVIGVAIVIKNNLASWGRIEFAK